MINAPTKTTLKLPRRMWAELYYAVTTKLNLIRQGTYDEVPDDPRSKEWAADMARLANRIERFLKKNEIEY